MLDPQYTTVRILIESGGITQFKEIIEHIPTEKLAHDLDWEASYLNYLVSNPANIKIDHMQVVSELLDCDIDHIAKVVINQFLAEKGK